MPTTHWNVRIAEHEPDLRAAADPGRIDSARIDRLLKAAESAAPEPPVLPAVWPTLAQDPAADYATFWKNNVRWSANELVRLMGGDKRPPRLGADQWKSFPGEAWFAAAQWKELRKSLQLLAAPPAFTAAAEREELFRDSMCEDSGAWDVPRGLPVERGPELGTTWCGKTDKLVWNPAPTSGTWLWLKQQLAGSFVFRQRYLATQTGEQRGLLILALCAAPLDSATAWEHASGPTMAHYYDYFDSYHFSLTRGGSGYTNLRRCGPGLVMLTSGSDPAQEAGRWYETAVVKHEGILDLYVDGRLACSYLDLGALAPRLDAGRIGFRHVQTFVAQHRDVRIAAL
ncbi:MAG: DUF1961 family protein [Kiritimatiellae bacterium]|nr:DUF1961 family protein [Kiritimatiellia bacterium]